MDAAVFVTEWDQLPEPYSVQEVLACIPALFKGARVHVNGAICCWCVVAAKDWLEAPDVKQAQATCWAGALGTCHSALRIHVLLNHLDHLEVAETLARNKVNRLTFLLDETDPEDDGFTLIRLWLWYWQRKAVDLDHDQDQPAARANYLVKRAALRWQEFVRAGWAGKSRLPRYCLGADVTAASSTELPSGFGLGISDLAGGHWGDAYRQLNTTDAVQGQAQWWMPQTSVVGATFPQAQEDYTGLARGSTGGTAATDPYRTRDPDSEEESEHFPINAETTKEVPGDTWEEF